MKRAVSRTIASADASVDRNPTRVRSRLARETMIEDDRGAAFRFAGRRRDFSQVHRLWHYLPWNPNRLWNAIWTSTGSEGPRPSAFDDTVPEHRLRDRLKRSFAKLADWFRNDLENEHDKHH
jgi:hypothetical protein